VSYYLNMIILLDKRNPMTRNSVCAIGSFDGVHRGHQAVVKRLRQHARSNNKVGIITFLPLPFFVLTSSPIIYLTVKREKEHLFKMLRVDFIYYFKFTKPFAQLSPGNFVELIARRINPSTVVVGDNFHFGQGRQGSAFLLKKISQNYFTVDIMSRIREHGTISSTRVRELILLGHIKAANKLLGRPYSLSGRIIRGKGKGAKIGFPTINIKVTKEKLLPLDGVYQVQVTLKEGSYLGAMFCRNDLIEVHIIDFKGDLYRKEVTIHIHRRIRGIEQFSDDKKLSLAIAHDIGTIRAEK
jgi:riboflavin kinase/FMN adenylyltransferase